MRGAYKLAASKLFVFHYDLNIAPCTKYSSDRFFFSFFLGRNSWQNRSRQIFVDYRPFPACSDSRPNPVGWGGHDVNACPISAITYIHHSSRPGVVLWDAQIQSGSLWPVPRLRSLGRH